MRVQLERLGAENARLLSENRYLRSALDAYVRRAQSSALFGPTELTAGTSIGPRRHAGVRNLTRVDTEAQDGGERRVMHRRHPRTAIGGNGGR